MSLVVTLDCIPQKQKTDPFDCFYTTSYAGGTTKSFMGGGIYEAATQMQRQTTSWLPSRPVGYIEGWYVIKDHRHRGVGRKLLVKAEDWARSHRCVEMGSDALIDNELSQRAHEALGYEVVDRCVRYRKRL